MKSVIVLPDANAIEEFVNCSRRIKGDINVSKQNFNYQIDASSLLGMMSLLGMTLVVEYSDPSDELNSVLTKYAV